MNSSAVQTTCCIAGGGPAGIMAGFLLARAGIRTIVLERHKDFFRDFRGDTIHPSTLQIMHELGLLDEFLKLPHEKVRSLRVLVGDTEIQVADFSHLPTVCKYIALMPQWDFLNFLAKQGRRSRRPGDPEQTGGFVNYGHLFVTLNRGDYWQCAFVIRKGGYDTVRACGLDAFRAEIVKLAPFLSDRVQELKDWDDIKLLTVAVDRLTQWWRPGLLCIGDAAHAMSPIGGVGVNLAVQDAVAAANILAAPLREGRLTTSDLEAVQRRRTFPMKVVQAMQLGVQSRIVDPLLDSDKPVTAPWIVRLFNRFPFLRRIPARIVGIGVRPEHVRSPQLDSPAGALAQS